MHGDIESNDDVDKHSLASSTKSKQQPRNKVVKSAGVVRMEAIARAADSRSGRYTLCMIAVACYAMYWIVSPFLPSGLLSMETVHSPRSPARAVLPRTLDHGFVLGVGDEFVPAAQFRYLGPRHRDEYHLLRLLAVYVPVLSSWAVESRR